MEAKFQIFMILLAVLAGTALLARRINIAPAILLLLAGIALAFVPGMPAVELPPNVVLLVVLPPLIYSASVAMSWREFKSNLRPIILLAVGCVIFTAFMVAAATHYLIGLPWSVGFLLGAIVAPPDVVAPLAIARKLGIPRRILVVLEGEGLANDATALILYRFAVAAISTGAVLAAQGHRHLRGHRRLRDPVRPGVGWLSLHARHRTRDPQIEITLSLITPYLAFWIPEHLGGSGVIATVACGLYISWNGPLLISVGDPPAGHLLLGPRDLSGRGHAVPAYGIPDATAATKNPRRSRSRRSLLTTALVVAIVIIARFAWVYPAIYLPRILSKRLRERDPAPSWRVTFVLGFTGVRGAVSLAAALALPLALPGGEGFPYRDMILFVAFGVIFITLVGLGSGLPLVVRWLGIAKDSRREHRRGTRSRDRGAARGTRCRAQVARCHHRRPRTIR